VWTGTEWSCPDKSILFPQVYGHGTIDVTTLQSLRSGLEEMTRDGYDFVWGGIEANKVVPRNRETCKVYPRPYALFDLDKGTVGAPGCHTPSDAREWWEHATDGEISAWVHGTLIPSIDSLPDYFRGVQCIVRPSSSCWIASTEFRGHLWFWLDRLVDPRVWGQVLPEKSMLDSSVYDPERIIFLAPPLFTGAPSPYPTGFRPREWWMDTDPTMQNVATVPQEVAYNPNLKPKIIHAPVVAAPFHGNTVAAQSYWLPILRKIKVVQSSGIGSRNKECFKLACDLQRNVISGNLPASAVNDFRNEFHTRTGLPLEEIEECMASALKYVQ
jgi:hypothetical protein